MRFRANAKTVVDPTEAPYNCEPTERRDRSASRRLPCQAGHVDARIQQRLQQGFCLFHQARTRVPPGRYGTRRPTGGRQIKEQGKCPVWIGRGRLAVALEQVMEAPDRPLGLAGPADSIRGGVAHGSDHLLGSLPLQAHPVEVPGIVRVFPETVRYAGPEAEQVAGSDLDDSARGVEGAVPARDQVGAKPAGTLARLELPYPASSPTTAHHTGAPARWPGRGHGWMVSSSSDMSKGYYKRSEANPDELVDGITIAYPRVEVPIGYVK